MTGRAVLTAIGPSGVRRYRIRLLRGHRQSNAPAATVRLPQTIATACAVTAAQISPLATKSFFGKCHSARARLCCRDGGAAVSDDPRDWFKPTTIDGEPAY